MELHVQLRHYIFIPNGRYSKNDFPPSPPPPQIQLLLKLDDYRDGKDK